MNTLKDKMAELGAKENILLSTLTSFHIGGPVAFIVEASNAKTVIKAFDACRENHFPVALIGNGSNLLCPDEGFKGAIIKLVRSDIMPEVKEGYFKAFAGDALTQISKWTVKSGYTGMEYLAGIPGTIGGAIAMNAGAYGGETIDVLKNVHILKNGVEQWVPAERALFGYRKSPFKWPEVITLEAEFGLKKGDGSEQTIMDECLAKRRDKQPLEFPSAGSVFKRPTGFFAGRLIEEAGLKGYRIGGAEISEKHAGFIINRGGASERDVLNLIDYICKTVNDKFGVLLEKEIIRLGDIVCTF